MLFPFKSRSVSALASSALLAGSLFAMGCDAPVSEVKDESPLGAVDPAKQEEGKTAQRIVSLGGAVTETLYALGVGSEIVASDTSSVYPGAANALPKVGYIRAASSEGIVSQAPTKVIASTDLGPPGLAEQLTELGVSLHQVSAERSVAAAKARISELGELVKRPQKAQELLSKLEAELAQAAKRVETVEKRPRVLFIYARGSANLLVAGSNSGAERMIELAGGQNSVEGFEGFRPLTAEGVLAAKPEVVLMAERGLSSLGGEDAIWSVLGIPVASLSPQPRLITMDDQLLMAFGPRTGHAVNELFELLHEGAENGVEGRN